MSCRAANWCRRVSYRYSMNVWIPRTAYMSNQFCLTAHPENTVLIDLVARRIVDWIEPATIEVYLFIDGGYSTSDRRELFLFNDPSLSEWYVGTTPWASGVLWRSRCWRRLTTSLSRASFPLGDKETIMDGSSWDYYRFWTYHKSKYVKAKNVLWPHWVWILSGCLNFNFHTFFSCTVPPELYGISSHSTHACIYYFTKEYGKYKQLKKSSRSNHLLIDFDAKHSQVLIKLANRREFDQNREKTAASCRVGTFDHETTGTSSGVGISLAIPSRRLLSCC